MSRREWVIFGVVALIGFLILRPRRRVVDDPTTDPALAAEFDRLNPQLSNPSGVTALLGLDPTAYATLGASS